ncbi:patatin-like phospholipase family protein [Candidatus Poribacteria bacterium]|nr:patatin-like phospholipase family protein [Candidatus Poribacteria bacterium]
MVDIDQNITILSLDGGGTRGIYTAHLLAKVEQELGVQIRDCFDLIVGTSTGAIVAGAAVSKISMVDIVQLFDQEAPEIFKQKWYRNQLLFSKYSQETLTEVIARHIPSILLADVETPVLLTCSEITTSDLHVFRSYASKKLNSKNPNLDISLRDAIVASCAAPTFFSPKKLKEHYLADGGLWANNPSIAALAEAKTHFKKDISQIKILSIGTGHSVSMYKERNGWGFISGWGGTKLISYVMALQSQTSAFLTQQLLNENYLRINPVIDFWDIDTIRHLDQLKRLAERDFTEYISGIQDFIQRDNVES